MAPAAGTGPLRGGRCVFAVLVPLAIAMVTILSSTIMTGVSEDAHADAHRLEREDIWDIPVMDTLRLWKRSMGTVGSGKLKLEVSYEDGEEQRFNTTERYYSKVLENTTRVFDEVGNMWVNVTKNYTVYGNWTRTLTQTTTIDGVTQATDAAISPNGKWYVVVTGYFSTTTNYGGYSCIAGNNNCLAAKGSVTVFRRDPNDMSLLFKHTIKLGAFNLKVVKFSFDGKHLYVVEQDVGMIYVFEMNNGDGSLTLVQHITDCAGTIATCEAVGFSRFLTGAIAMVITYDDASLYLASHTDKTVVFYSRNTTSGLLTYGDAYNPSGKFFTALIASRDGKNVYAGSTTLSSKSAVTGQIFMFKRSTLEGPTLGRLTLLVVPSSNPLDYGFNPDKLGQAVFDPIVNPLEDAVKMRFPRSFVIDYTDRYLFALSYSLSKVVAYERDPDTGVLMYKTSHHNKAQALTTVESTAIKFPINMVMSGDGGSLYVASDVNDNIATIKIEVTTQFPTPVPTSAPTDDYYPRLDNLSYSSNLACSTSSCKSLWPDAVADFPGSRFDSASVCGGSCFTDSGSCKVGSLNCAFSTEVIAAGAVNGTVEVANYSEWSSSRDWCESNGARLCTVDEIAFDETTGSGCWSEDDLMWSSTACSEMEVDSTTILWSGYYAIAPSARQPTTEAVCLTNTSRDSDGLIVQTRTRCCADVICGGATPSPTMTRKPTLDEPTITPSPAPTNKPTEQPSMAPTTTAWDIKLTYVEDFSNIFILNQPNGMVVSPDWYSLYVVGTESNTIVGLRRNATTPNPTGAPTFPPSPLPTYVPTPIPSPLPTYTPTPVPTPLPTYLPTPVPTPLPTAQPTPLPTAQPTPVPTTPEPSSVPTPIPSPAPTREPSPFPSSKPTHAPIPQPSPQPSPVPTIEPTHMPTPTPSRNPTPIPTPDPTHIPTPAPTTPEPSQIPTPAPTAIPQYYIRPMNSSEWCWTLPKADTPSGYRNGLVPTLGRCVGSKSQRWSFDLQRKELHPQNAYDWCLDMDFDKGVRRPVTVFRCGKTFSAKAEKGHQKWDWDFPNSGSLKNVGTNRCAATGKEVYQGRYIQSWFCDATNQDWDFVLVEETN